ncbi:MAG: hypothetical protein ACOY3E_04835 [Pseudomonadota bacterium]
MNTRALLLLISAMLLAGCNDSQSQSGNGTASVTDQTTNHASDVAVDAATGSNANSSEANHDSADMPALAGTSGAAAGTGEPGSLEQYQASLSRRCETDSDCVVKNVGNCCGYAPQCVHKDVQTFPEQVKALCEKEGRSSICGFQEPAGCACVENQCRESNAAM